MWSCSASLTVSGHLFNCCIEIRILGLGGWGVALRGILSGDCPEIGAERSFGNCGSTSSSSITILCGGINDEPARLSFAASARRAAVISRPCTREAIEATDVDEVAAEVSMGAVLAVAAVFVGPL